MELPIKRQTQVNKNKAHIEKISVRVKTSVDGQFSKYPMNLEDLIVFDTRHDTTGHASACRVRRLHSEEQFLGDIPIIGAQSTSTR